MRVEQVRTAAGTYTVHVDGDDPRLPFAVFLHGGPGLNSYAERCLLGGRFTSAANFLWFDHLGCGDFVPAAPGPLTWREQVDDIAFVIRRFTREPVHVVGHCLGTELTHDLVRRDRDLVRSVLWYAPTRWPGEILRALPLRAAAENRLAVDTLPDESRAALDRFRGMAARDFGAADVRPFLGLAAQIRDLWDLYWTDRTALQRYVGWMAAQPFSMQTFVDLIEDFFERGPLPLPDYTGIPVHMLYGDDDPVSTWDVQGRELAESIPHATAAPIAGGGHWTHFQRPDECVRRTLEVLVARV